VRRQRRRFLSSHLGSSEPLSEPYLNLSAHTAPAMEPRRAPICQCAHNFGSRLEDTRDPMRRPAQMPAQLLVFLIGPAGQQSIQLSHRRIERRPVKPPVILEPASNDRLNIRDRSSIDLSLRRCRFQLRLTRFSCRSKCSAASFGASSSPVYDGSIDRSGSTLPETPPSNSRSSSRRSCGRCFGKTRWSTPSQAFGGPAQELRYLGRYTHRVAISNHRLLEFDGERVTFRWKGYNFDLNLTKSIPFGEARRLELRWEALNAFIVVAPAGFWDKPG
jgi:hypothetical protein